jgi:hypothetical protein
MNHLFFLWFAAQSAYQAYSQKSDLNDQRAVEAYLGQSQSISDLEYRERQWMRAH